MDATAKIDEAVRPVLEGVRWYVVYTEEREEMTARKHLQKLGFECFLPRYRKLRRHARKIEPVFSPLFPRYLFVAFDARVDRWRQINVTRGVARLITSGEVPLPISAGELERLRVKCGTTELLPEDPAAVLKPGQRVIITSGCFADQVAQYEGTDEGRVILLLDLLGQRVKLRALESQVATLTG